MDRADNWTVRRGAGVPAAAAGGFCNGETAVKQRQEYVQRLRRLEAFLCSGRRSKADCRSYMGYRYERAFSRDLEDLEALGSGIVRSATPGKASVYYCPRAKAVFRH